MLEDVMRAGDALKLPPILFEALLDVPAVGQHAG
jgi:hypothetical protein